jgi:hypothetical protein
MYSKMVHVMKNINNIGSFFLFLFNVLVFCSSVHSATVAQENIKTFSIDGNTNGQLGAYESITNPYSEFTLSSSRTKEFKVLGFDINPDTLEAAVSVKYVCGKKHDFRSHLQARGPEDISLHIAYQPTTHLGALVDVLNSDSKILPQRFEFFADNGEDLFVDLVFSRLTPLRFKVSAKPLQVDQDHHCSYAQIEAVFTGSNDLATPRTVHTFLHKRDTVAVPKKYCDVDGYLHSIARVSYEYDEAEKAWHVLHGITPPDLPSQEIIGDAKEGLILSDFWRDRKITPTENNMRGIKENHLYIADTDSYFLCGRHCLPQIYLKPALTALKPVACDRVGEFQVGRYYKLKNTQTLNERTIYTWKPLGFSGDTVTLSSKEAPLSIVYPEEACRRFNFFAAYFEGVNADDIYLLSPPPISIHFDHIDLRNKAHRIIFQKWGFQNILVDRITLADEAFEDVFHIGEHTYRTHDTVEKLAKIMGWSVTTFSLINKGKPITPELAQLIVDFTRRNKVSNFEIDLGNNDFTNSTYELFDNRCMPWKKEKKFEPKILLTQKQIKLDHRKKDYRLTRVLPEAQCTEIISFGKMGLCTYDWSDLMPLLERNKSQLQKLDVDGSSIPPARFFSLLSEMKNLTYFRAVDVAWSYQPIFTHSYSLQMAQSLASLKKLKEVRIDLPIRIGFMAVSNRLDCEARDALKKLKPNHLVLYYPTVEVFGLWTREGLAKEMNATWGSR